MLQNEKPCDLHRPPNIISAVKLRRLQCTGRVPKMQVMHTEFFLKIFLHNIHEEGGKGFW